MLLIKSAARSHAFSAGPQIVMNVQSGSDEHRFRRLHAVFALIKHVNTPHRLEFYASLEPVRVITSPWLGK